MQVLVMLKLKEFTKNNKEAFIMTILDISKRSDNNT